MLLELARFLFYVTLGQLFQGLVTPWKYKTWVFSLLLLRACVLCTFGAWTIGFMSGDTSIVYTCDHLQNINGISGAIGILWAGAAGANLLFWLGMSESCLRALQHLPRDIAPELSLKLQRVVLPHLIFMGAVVLWHSNPFARYWPFPPAHGAELSPLLQHQALSYHPPMLLLGTASFFGLMLLEAYEKICGAALSFANRRRWLLSSIGVLGLGITAGSHWAYHVLGWGGWWFWDPIETISLITWVGGLALLHHHRAGAFHPWSSFSLWATIVIGLVLVRGGGLVSVHSFVHEKPSAVLLSFAAWAVLSAVWPISLKNKPSVATSATGLIVTACIMLSGLLIPVVLVIFGAQSAHLGASYYEGTVGVCLLFFLLLESAGAFAALLYLSCSVFFTINLTPLWAALLLITELLRKQSSRTRVVAHNIMLIGISIISIAPSFERQQYLYLQPGGSTDILGARVEYIRSSTKTERDHQKSEHELIIHYQGQKLRCVAQKVFYPSWGQELTPISYVTTWRGEDFGLSVLPDQSGLRLFYRPFVRLTWGLMILINLIFLTHSLLWDFKIKDFLQCNIRPFFYLSFR